MAESAGAVDPGTGPDLGADLELGLELADLADAITRRWWRDPALSVRRKADGTPVTAADEQVEEALRVRLAAARPGDAILGEEQGLSGPFGTRRTWVIDPIDGTAHFARGRAGFATLISLLVDGVPLVGIVAMPAREMRWWGAVGLDADSTHGPLRVSAAAVPGDSSIAVGDPFDWDQGRRRGLDALRRTGAELYPAADVGLFCDVAEGRADAALAPSGALWDLAAPYALVTAAGGRCTDLSGASRADGGSLLAAGSALHPRVLAAFSPASD
ncbi:MAG: histidinol phosphatase [Cryptosporangiaceae bacterium]|jgi:histidinol-phosphatase|nr:histidinol phosphatase [Cryptosporangiaceae bacterium]